MTETKTYGSWPSPIHSTWLTQQSVRLGEPQLGPNGCYWVESRPQEKGRCVLMHKPLGEGSTAAEVLPTDISVHSKAHEYGGASYLITDDRIFYVDASDQRIYCARNFDHSTSIEIKAITPKGNFRYADFCFDTKRQRLIAVREDHRRKNSGDATEESNALVAVDISGNMDVELLVEGCDFYANPRLSPNQQQLTWLCWKHPFMPWDSSECQMGQVNDQGRIDTIITVAGGIGESIFQPQWSPDGDLYLVSDRNDWWNIYAVNLDQEQPNLVATITKKTYTHLRAHETL
ncbi:MAG: hypothetical protein ACRBBW_14780, partial [Cellvibrionaceae bacterium]